MIIKDIFTKTVLNTSQRMLSNVCPITWNCKFFGTIKILKLLFTLSKQWFIYTDWTLSKPCNIFTYLSSIDCKPVHRNVYCLVTLVNAISNVLVSFELYLFSVLYHNKLESYEKCISNTVDTLVGH